MRNEKKIKKICRDLEALQKLIYDGERLKSKAVATKENYELDIILSRNTNSGEVLGLIERREIKKIVERANKKIREMDILIGKIEETKSMYEKRFRELKAVLDSYLREDIYYVK